MSQPNRTFRRVVVLDTSAFVAGFDPFRIIQRTIDLRKVEEEIRRSSMVKTRFEAAVESDKLKIRAPPKNTYRKQSCRQTKLVTPSSSLKLICSFWRWLWS